jgi:hypothetical protein
VLRHLDPSAPEELRIAAARGAIPLAPAERLASLTTLLGDPSAVVRREARNAWRELPPDFIQTAVADPRLPESTLDLVAALQCEDCDLIYRVLEHPRVGARTLGRFAESGDEEILSRIAQNQRALHARPEIARRVLRNPRLHVADRSRLTSLYGVESPTATENEAPPLPTAVEPAGIEEEAPPLPVLLPIELIGDDVEPDKSDPKNLYQLIQGLSVAEKIKLANLGSKSARRLLIRDNNKVVASAVVRSPKIREDEILAIAQDRTVAEEVVRIILQRKDWMKSYPLRLALCQNPKTPIPKAMRLLETLRDKDLRQVAKSRNVSGPVSSGATRLLVRRGKL